jgi:hypothetical protein
MSTDPGGQSAVDLGGAAESGEPADARAQLALARLDALIDTDVARHPGIFEEVHELLDGVLAYLDGTAEPARAPTPRPRPGPGTASAPGVEAARGGGSSAPATT